MEKVPTDLRKVLAAAPKVMEMWKDLTPIARRDFTSWIEGAKQLETRKRRVERVHSMLTSGKRRPCCYAIVPMNLYKALADSPKAKAVWKDLTPDERRDFVGWIDEAKESETRTRRIEKTCALLASGKRHP
ncbi:MAG: YdeI/OmpD-associated family protein [Minisyncoccia bacterium]